MISSVYRHRVRYRECDPMSVVYHAHYLDYFEAARTEALRDLGLAYRDLEASGVIMPVVRAEVHYRRPARYDDLLEITVLFPEIPRVRVPIDYEVRHVGAPELIATGRVVLCFMDAARNRPIPIPPDVRALFEAAWAGLEDGG